MSIINGGSKHWNKASFSVDSFVASFVDKLCLLDGLVLSVGNVVVLVLEVIMSSIVVE